MKTPFTPFILAVLFLSCGDKDPEFDATGTFEAEEVIISSEVSGTIEHLDIREGSPVEHGQLLGWIDSTQLHLRKKQLLAQVDALLSKRPQVATQLASFRVQLATAERELQRMQNLYEAEAATQKQVDDAAAQLAIIRRQMEAHRSSLDIASQGLISETLPLLAQVEQIEEQIRSCRIVNPVTGIILQRYSKVHELATPGKPLYKVADLTELELHSYVTGDQLSGIKLNQDVTVLVDSGHSEYKTYPGVITWVASEAQFTPKTIHTRDERADLVYAMKVRVKNDGLLRIGMYGEVKF